MATTPKVPVQHQTSAPGAQTLKPGEMFRVGGSGFTVFTWEGKPIGFAQTVAHQSPQPVAAPEAIQPMDQRYPLQVITPAAIGVGTIQLQMFEMYNSKVWDRIMQVVDAKHPGGNNRPASGVYNDLVAVFVRLANIGRGITVTKIIYAPNESGNTSRYTAENYHNATITDIRDDENIDIGSMSIVKSLTIQYTKMTRSSANA